jgi:hypothetical protein
MSRSGSVVSYLAAEGGGDFTLLQEFQFTGEDLQDVRIVGSTGDSKRAALDTRVTEVRISATSLTNVPDAPLPTAGSKSWFAIPAAALLALAVAVGVVIAVVRRRRAAKVSAAGEREAKPDTPAPPISFPCPSCGGKLKARADLTGKKFRCPRCSKAVVVPGIGAGDRTSTSVQVQDSGGTA